MAELNLEKDKKLLVVNLRKLKSSKDLSIFIDDLLTEEEILDLVQRVRPIGINNYMIFKNLEMIRLLYRKMNGVELNRFF